MRTTVLSYIGFMAIFIEVLILSLIISHSAYEAGIRQNLEDSVELSMAILQTGYQDKRDDVLQSNGILEKNTTLVFDKDLDSFKTEFLQYLTKNLDARITDVDIDIYGADEENGLLSVKITAAFSYFGNKKGSVSTTRTIVLNTNKKEV